MIGLKEIRRRKLQFALIAAVVTLISYLVLMINGLGVGLNRQAGSALLKLDADVIAYSSASRLSVIRSELSTQVVSDAGRLDGVTDYAPIGYLSVNASSPSGNVAGVALLGYMPGHLGEPAVKQGRKITPQDQGAVLADAKFLKASNLSLGDSLTVVNRLQTYKFSVVGIVDEGYFFFQPVIYLPLDSLRQVKYGSINADTPLASIVLLKGKNLLGASTGDLTVVSKKTAFANIEGVKGQQQTVDALRLFGFLIGALVVGIFFYVLTLQKIQQVGTLKALGASNGYLFRQTILQVLTIIIAGAAISTALAYGTNDLLSRLPQAVPISFTPSTFLITASTFIVTGMIGVMFSLHKVSRVDPIIAIGQQQ